MSQEDNGLFSSFQSESLDSPNVPSMRTTATDRGTEQTVSAYIFYQQPDPFSYGGLCDVRIEIDGS